MTIPQRSSVYKSFRYGQIAHEHLRYCLHHEKLFVHPNFSLIQYCNERNIRNVIRSHEYIWRDLKRWGYDDILNIGTGGGWLEAVAREDGVSIDTVEWIEQQQMFYALRNALNVKLTYTMNDITQDDFIIEGLSRQYDLGIAFRFFPFNKTHCSSDQIVVRLKKLHKYIKRIALVDHNNNYTDDGWKLLHSLADSSEITGEEYRVLNINLEAL